jgi:hypothetical protein
MRQDLGIPSSNDGIGSTQREYSSFVISKKLNVANVSLCAVLQRNQEPHNHAIDLNLAQATQRRKNISEVSMKKSLAKLCAVLSGPLSLGI